MSVAAASTTTTALGSQAKQSFGNVNVEFQDQPIISGNVSAVCTAAGLSRVDYAIIIGVAQTAVPTYSGNAVTFTFVDPVATIKAQVILIGR